MRRHMVGFAMAVLVKGDGLWVGGWGFGVVWFDLGVFRGGRMVWFGFG